MNILKWLYLFCQKSYPQRMGKNFRLNIVMYKLNKLKGEKEQLIICFFMKKNISFFPKSR